MARRSKRGVVLVSLLLACSFSKGPGEVRVLDPIVDQLRDYDTLCISVTGADEALNGSAEYVSSKLAPVLERASGFADVIEGTGACGGPRLALPGKIPVSQRRTVQIRRGRVDQVLGGHISVIVPHELGDKLGLLSPKFLLDHRDDFIGGRFGRVCAVFGHDSLPSGNCYRRRIIPNSRLSAANVES